MVTVGPDKPRSYSGDYMEEGRIAEKIVMELLRRQPQIVELTDLRAIRAVHEADVDLCVLMLDGRVRFAEIKSDRHLGISGNVLFEVLRINHTAPAGKACVLGWTARTPATWIFYYAPGTQKVYQCRAYKLQRALQRYSQECRKMTRLDWVSTDNLKSTINILIPWRYCEDFFTIWDASACGGNK